MVLCLLALPLFAILGIFSIKYRKLAKDALDCMFRTITFRKCHTGLDDRIKSDISGTILKYSPKAARFFYNNYKFISWIILILFIWSAYASAVGVYNYAEYGSCNEPEETGFCVLAPTQDSGVSEIDIHAPEHTTPPKTELNDPIIGPANASLTIIEFGCYTCSYTKKAEPIIKEVLDYYGAKVNLQFKSFPIPSHKLSFTAANAADCAFEQGKYEQYYNALFKMQSELSEEGLKKFAEDLELDTEQFNACYDTEKYKDEIASDTLAGVQAGVGGTPTFFINGEKIVGPKPFKTFKTIIDRELEAMK